MTALDSCLQDKSLNVTTVFMIHLITLFSQKVRFTKLTPICVGVSDSVSPWGLLQKRTV